MLTSGTGGPRQKQAPMILIAAIWIILFIAFIWTFVDYRRYLSRYNVQMTYPQFLKSYWNRIWRL